MKKRLNKILALACALALVVGSLAYFTDRAELNASVTSGSVGIDENATENWGDQLKAGPQSLDNINPGDSRSLKFTVTNTDNKAIDVRHTIKLSVVDATGNTVKVLSEGADIGGVEMAQFDIFKASDVTTLSTAEGNNAGYVLAQGAEPVFSSDSVDTTTKMGASRTFDATTNTITYYFADSVLDGTGTAAETGYKLASQLTGDAAIADADVAALVDANGDASTTAVTYDYVLIFRDNAMNDFQGSKLHVEMVVEAKQHLNTNSSWQDIYTEKYELGISGVAGHNTTIDVAPDNQHGELNEATGTTEDHFTDVSSVNTQGDSGKE